MANGNKGVTKRWIWGFALSWIDNAIDRGGKELPRQGCQQDDRFLLIEFANDGR